MFLYGKLVFQLIFHKKSPQNVIYIRRKKFIGMERLIWMRIDSLDKDILKSNFNFFFNKTNSDFDVR